MLMRLRQIAAATRQLADPVFVRRLAELEAELQALEWLTLRALSEHGTPAATQWPAGSVLHVLGSELQQKTGAMLVEALGERGVIAYPDRDDDETPTACPPGPDFAPGVTADFLYRRAVTIYGGSNEIQRNLIARHWLGA